MVKKPRAKKVAAPCKLYIVRHGETEYNVSGQMQGIVDSPLTQKGREQAKQRAADLASTEFAAIYASDLGRAVATAEILKLDREMIILTTKLLRERSFGTFDGQPVSVWREELQEKLAERDQLSAKDLFSYVLREDIETDQVVFTRCITFLREVAVAHPGKNVLLVSHGGVMRTILIHLGYGTPQKLQSNSVTNLGYFVLESDGTDFSVVETHGIEQS